MGKGRKCVDCKPGSQRRAPHPGPRCATHHRAVKQKRNQSDHARHIEETYGITIDDYWRLFHWQGGVCAVCRRATGRKVRLSVDHDHACCPGPTSCGACVRMLCCRSCNSRVLGHLRDSVDALQRAIDCLNHPPYQQMKENDE